MEINQILSSTNTVASATINGQVVNVHPGVPLGVTDGGELVVKVDLVGSGTSAAAVTVQSIAAQPGAASIATAQVTAATTAGVLAASRATRRFVTIVNADGTNPAFVGVSTVATTTGFRIGPAQSQTFNTTAALSVISSGTGALVTILETFD